MRLSLYSFKNNNHRYPITLLKFCYHRWKIDWKLLSMLKLWCIKLIKLLLYLFHSNPHKLTYLFANTYWNTNTYIYLIYFLINIIIIIFNTFKYLLLSNLKYLVKNYLCCTCFTTVVYYKQLLFYPLYIVLSGVCSERMWIF